MGRRRGREKVVKIMLRGEDIMLSQGNRNFLKVNEIGRYWNPEVGQWLNSPLRSCLGIFPGSC